MEESKADFEKLLDEARKASENSYSPYSKFPVGAASLFESGKIYKGSNVENASYGLGICAERNCLSTALSDGEKTRLVAIAVYSPRQKCCLPCGACLQWLDEFSSIAGNNDITVILENDNGVLTYKLSELLPHGFKIN